MVIQKLQENSVGLKIANTLVSIKSDGTLKIGDRETEGAGEYDIAGVGAHVLDSSAVLFAEGIRVGVIWPITEKPDFDSDINIDILIPFVSDLKQITSFIKEQDPRVVVFVDSATAQNAAQQDGLTVTQEGNYKITAQSLPVDDRVFVSL